MSETSVPTMADIQQAKLDMTDINTFVGSSNDQFTDNGGTDRLTVTGIINKAIVNAGYIDRGTFSAGATLTKANEILQYLGEFYRWSGPLPKTVVAGASPTPSGVGGWIIVGDALVRTELREHENDASAHPALVQLVTNEANRAELAAEAALTNGNIYPNIAAGQADSGLANFAYFWSVSSESQYSLELWQKGLTTPIDTGKRILSAEYVKQNGTEDLALGLSFAVVGEDNSRTWIEADEEGKPTEYAAELIRQSLPVITSIDEIPKPELNTQAFAIIGEDNSRTWLEVDEEGKPTAYSVECITEAMTDINADQYTDSTGKSFNVSSGPNIVAWGDSMTAGATGVPYTDYLQQIFTAEGIDGNVVNNGVGGESSVTITARTNANPFTVTVVGGQIPASGRIAVNLLPINGVIVEPFRQSGNFTCTFAGITGIFGATNTGGNYGYWFERASSGDTIDITRPEPVYLNIGEQSRGDIAIIWIGQNQPNWVDGVDNYTKVNERAINDAKAIIQYLTAIDKRYLVITAPSGGHEKDPFDARWFEELGQRYIPIRQYMATPIYASNGITIVSCYGLDDAGFEATPQDIIEIGEGRIPVSLRNDGVHWKAEGYEILAKIIYKKLKQLGWV